MLGFICKPFDPTCAFHFRNRRIYSIVSGWAELFGLSGFSMVVFVPGAIFELILHVWLFAKGFSERILNYILATYEHWQTFCNMMYPAKGAFDSTINI